MTQMQYDPKSISVGNRASMVLGWCAARCSALLPEELLPDRARSDSTRDVLDRDDQAASSESTHASPKIAIFADCSLPSFGPCCHFPFRSEVCPCLGISWWTSL